ncbi:hypothetical protein GOP47_0003077 [Adiantum capillus-veneris]|uniref:Uncharacterized protein n=1 Tax=Adiantum capillus-veneris TaxID=13818 RepID=A0A9D4ZPR7_ADICA|nr:hypothetical protein GOP47_0003077 [Adiantum capillus-veneris]
MEGNKGTDYFSIQPPKLEDAGLEDPALPIEGIQEAFRRVAESVQAKTGVNIHFGTSDGGMGDLVVDPLPEQRGKGQSCTGQEIDRTTPYHDAIVTPSEDLKEDLVLEGKEKGPKLGKERCTLGDSEPKDDVQKM